MTNSEAIDSSVTTQSVIPAWTPSSVKFAISVAIAVTVFGFYAFLLTPIFKLPDLPEMGFGASTEVVQAHHSAWTTHYGSNDSLNGAILGLLLGSLTAVVASGAKKVQAILVGGLAGAVAGALSGYGFAVIEVRSMIQSSDKSIVESVGLHTLVWACAIGFAWFGVAATQSNIKHAVQFLVVGAVIGFAVAVAYNLVAPIIAPDINLMRMIPESTSAKLLWAILSLIVTSLGSALSVARIKLA